MDISYKWLKDYLNFDLTPQETADALTSIGLENGPVSEVELVKGGLKGLVVGEVLTCENHPNSDHLHVTTVNVGQKEPLKIVCGAPNCRKNLKTIVATIGTELYDGDNSFKIKKSKMRGEESFGMLCAEDEIGIGRDHDGIIELPSNAKVGMPASEYYDVESEYVLDIDITANRGDATSHFGVARDLYAYLKTQGADVKLNKPSVEDFKVEDNSFDVDVKVEDTEACPRFAGVTISGIEVKESPKWLKDKLNSIGLRPINNIVDITNFVLFETGQPMHCYDGDKIKGNSIVVKFAKEGQKFTTLDLVERELKATDLVVCNSQEPMSLGGVFGGADSGVTEKTSKIFLESAYFNPVTIRKTARSFGLNTDASFRFERGIDPDNTIYALKRAALLVKELAGGKISSEIKDIYPKKINGFNVSLSYDRINSVIGKVIPKDVVKNIVSSLEMKIVSETPESLNLLVPAYRVDVQRDVDVIEDILRIYGYNNIDFTDKIQSTIQPAIKPDSHQIKNMIAEQLTGSGFNEILNNSLTSVSFYQDLKSYPLETAVKLLNPLSSDLGVMRQTLLFGGLQNISYNINRKNFDLKFYEYGNCYHFNEAKKGDEKDDLAAYREDYHLSLWITGNKVVNSWSEKDVKYSVYDLKSYVENIFARVGVANSQLIVQQVSDDIYSTSLKYSLKGGKVLAQMGILNDKILDKFGIKQEVYFADIVWAEILRASSRVKVEYKQISKFPEVSRDLSMLLDDSVTFADIEKLAYSTEKKLLKSVKLFDVYEGAKLLPGKKSYAVNFVLQDETKTLNDKQIDKVMTKLIKTFENKLNATLR